MCVDRVWLRVRKIVNVKPVVPAKRHFLAAAVLSLVVAYSSATRYSPTSRRTRGLLNNQVRTLIGQGNLCEAEEVARSAHVSNVQSLGRRHPHTLNSGNGLAVVLWQLGKITESERLLRSTLHLMNEELGPSHHDTLTVKDNLRVIERSHGDGSARSVPRTPASATQLPNEATAPALRDTHGAAWWWRRLATRPTRQVIDRVWE